jgi:hypothetical protein
MWNRYCEAWAGQEFGDCAPAFVASKENAQSKKAETQLRAACDFTD